MIEDLGTREHVITENDNIMPKGQLIILSTSILLTYSAISNLNHILKRMKLHEYLTNHPIENHPCTSVPPDSEQIRCRGVVFHRWELDLA